MGECENKPSIWQRIKWFVKDIKRKVFPEKSSMELWAEKEIEIAKKRENPQGNKDWDYGCACYDSAYKAFKSLLKDGHSGMSISITKNILVRLIEGKPLTPITEDDFKDVAPKKWESPEFLKERGLRSSLQCPRMSSLFREEDLNGMEVSYRDIDRVCGRNKTTNHCWSGKRFSEYVDKMFPITLPYYPKSKPYEVIADDCKFNKDDRRNDWDTEAYYEIITPDGEHISINEFYKYENGERIAITEEEYNERKKASEEGNNENII